MIPSNFFSKRWCGYLWVFVLVLVSVNGCGKAPEKLRIGHEGLINGKLLEVAADDGFLDRSRYDLLTLPSSTYILKALNNQLIDVAVLSLHDVLSAHSTNPDIRVFQLLSFSAGVDALVAQRSITDLGALPGKTVGVDSDLLGSYLLQRALDQEGIAREDITLRVVEPQDQLEVFTRREVDALVTQEPLLSQLIASGGKPLFDSRHIASEVLYVLVANTNTVCHKLPMIAELRSGWFDAVNRLRWHGAELAGGLAKQLGLGYDQTSAVIKKIRFATRAENDAIAASGGDFERALRKVQQLMQQQGLLQQPLALENILLERGGCE